MFKLFQSFINTAKVAISSAQPAVEAPLFASAVTPIKPANNRFFVGAAAPKAGATALIAWSVVKEVGKYVAHDDKTSGSYLSQALSHTLIKFDPAKLDKLRQQYGVPRPYSSRPEPESRPALGNRYIPSPR